MGTTPQPHLTDASDDAVSADATRRSFLKTVAIGGAAAAVGSQLVSLPAFGQESTTTTAAEDAAAEEGPELSADEQTIAFLAGLSLAAAAAYKAATGDEGAPAESDEEAASEETTTTLAPIQVAPIAEPVAEILRDLGAQHTGQATAFSALLAEPVTEPNGTLLSQVRSQLGATTDEASVLGILSDMTDALAATQLTAIGSIEVAIDTKVVAAALPVLGQHAVVLGQLSTPPVEVVSLLPVEQTTDGALTEAAYPTDDSGASADTSTTTTTDPSSSGGGQGAESTTTTGPSTGSGTESDTGGAADTETSEG